MPRPVRVIPIQLGQYHCCWCPGSLCCQVISKIMGRTTDHPWLMVGWSVLVLVVRHSMICRDHKGNYKRLILILLNIVLYLYLHTVIVCGIGFTFRHRFPWGVTNMDQALAKNDLIFYFYQNLKKLQFIHHWSPNGPSVVGPWVAWWIHRSHLATGRPYFSSTAHNIDCA